MRIQTEPTDAEALADLAARVREKREEAVGAMPPREGPGCPVCRGWRLRNGEERDDDGHAPGCALRGVTVTQREEGHREEAHSGQTDAGL